MSSESDVVAVVASLTRHPSLRQVLLPSLDGHRRWVGWSQWLACKSIDKEQKGVERGGWACIRGRAASSAVGLCWTAGRSGAHHGLCEPQPVSAPSHPHDTSHRSQLYIAALNVLIGISRAQHLEVRVTTAAHTFHGRLALLPCMGHCCCVPPLPLLLLCTCPAQTRCSARTCNLCPGLLTTAFVDPHASQVRACSYNNIGNEWLDWLHTHGW